VQCTVGLAGWRLKLFPFGDVSAVYLFWAEQALTGGNKVGIDEPWVYPVAALVPMVLAALLGSAN